MTKYSRLFDKINIPNKPQISKTTGVPTIDVSLKCYEIKMYSDTGNRTRATWVRARYPNH